MVVNKLSASKVASQVFIETDTKIRDLAAKLEIKPQSLSNKLSRGGFSFNDFVQMMDLAGGDVIVRIRESGKEFLCSPIGK